MSAFSDRNTSVRGPLVSVIMANFNGSTYLAKAIDSVQKQTLRDIEIIISDDASTDHSIEIVTRLQTDDPRIRLIRGERNAGPAIARNRAIDVASGQWIAIVDGDDFIQPARLDMLVEYALRDGADIVADDLFIISPEGQQHSNRFLRKPWSEGPFWVDIVDYLWLNRIYGRGPGLGYLKPIFSASLFSERAIRYNDTLKNSEDYDLVLRLLYAGKRMRVYPVPLYFYRKHSNSLSHRLNENVLEALLSSDRYFLAQVNPANSRLHRAARARMNSTKAALTFERLLSAIKSHHYLTAFAIVTVSPRAAALLRLPLAARVRRFLLPEHDGNIGTSISLSADRSASEPHC